MRIAIVVGHNSVAQGAVRVSDKRTEFDWNTELAHAIQALSPDQVKVFHRVKNPRGYRAELGEVYATADEWGADVACELHFNAVAGNATGTETWYVSTSGREVARAVQSGMVNALGLRDRGIKKAGPLSRGYSSLVTGRAPAVLIEPYFGSNQSDCDVGDRHFGDLAAAIYSALSGEEIEEKVPGIDPGEAYRVGKYLMTIGEQT